MSSILLHVGYQKTGSTWLQRRLFCNTDAGFFAPCQTEWHDAISEFVLVHPRRFDPGKARASFQPYIEAANAAGHVPVLSHEALCDDFVMGRYYGFEVAPRLYAAFPEAKVLIVIREQQSMVQSVYRFYLSLNGTDPIEYFIGTGEESPGFATHVRREYLEYDLLISNYMDLFGRDRVCVAPMEMLQRDPSQFVSRIRQFAGVLKEVDVDVEPENVNLPSWTLELRRRLNYIAPLGNFDRPKTLRRKVSDKICALTSAIAPEVLNYRRQQHWQQYIRKQLKGRFRESNRRLAKMTGLDLASFGYEM